MTQFYAVNVEKAAVFEFGSGFTLESAYEHILKADSGPEEEFMPGFDFIFVDDVGDEYIFEMDCWAPRHM